MTFKKHLETGIGIPLLAFLLFSTVFYLQVRWIGNSIGQVTEIEAPRCEAITNMKVELNGISFGLVGYLNDPKGEGVSWIEEYKKEFRGHLMRYCSLSQVKKDESATVEIDRSSSLLCRMAEEVVNLNNLKLERLKLLRESLEEADAITSEQYNKNLASSETQDLGVMGPIIEAKFLEDELQEAINCYEVNRSEKCVKKLYKSQEKFGKFLNEYLKTEESKDHVWLLRLSELHIDCDGLIRDIIALDEKKQVRLEEFRKKKDRLRWVLASQIEQTKASFEGAAEKSRYAVTTSTMVMLFLIFFAVVVAFVSQQYVSFMIIQPMGKLLSAANKIGRGYYDTRVDIESDDELGELAAAMNKIAQQMRQAEESQNSSGGKSHQKNKTPLSV
ncbi:MAG: HAMP domain-containing protein [Phycisphaerae bacterium]|jgi:HAMP domain-containing protein